MDGHTTSHLGHLLRFLPATPFAFDSEDALKQIAEALITFRN
ncbi:MAG: hypothetical protein WBN03_04600 [Desulfobacterales bacterium]